MIKKQKYIYTIAILLLFLMTKGSYADRPAEPTIDLVAGVSLLEGTLYTQESTITIEGSTQYNTIVEIYIDNIKQNEVIESSGKWIYTFTKPQKSSYYQIKVRAIFIDDIEYSMFSETKQLFIDYSNPSISVKNRSRWQGDYLFVRNELKELYADIADSGGCGFGISPTFNGKLYDITSGIPGSGMEIEITGTTSFNGSNKLYFTPTNGMGSSTFTDEHKYRLWFEVYDQAENYISGYRDFKIDYTNVSQFDSNYTLDPTTGEKKYDNIYIYDPEHAPKAEVDPGNYPLTEAESIVLAGDNRLEGFVRFYNKMIVVTNPTRFFIKFTPGEWASNTSYTIDNPEMMKLHRYGEYIDGWNNYGGWHYLKNYNNSYPATSNENIGNADPANGWLCTKPFMRPQGKLIDNWFYLRDPAYNRKTLHFYFYCETGPPKAPMLVSSTQYKDGNHIIAAGADRTIQDVAGIVYESGQGQTAELYRDNSTTGVLIGSATFGPTNYEEANRDFVIANNNHYQYHENGVSRLYMIAKNEEYGYGPYTYWYAAYTDNTKPEITGAFQTNSSTTTFFNKNTVPTTLKSNIYEYPYLAWSSIFGIKTDQSYMQLIDKNKNIYSTTDTSWFKSGEDYSGILNLSTDTQTNIANLEQSYYAKVYAIDNYGLTNTKEIKVFSIDNTAPDLSKILPVSDEQGTVNSLEKFTAEFSDPILNDNTSGSGPSMKSGSLSIGDMKYSQIYIFKYIANQNPTNSYQFNIELQKEFQDPMSNSQIIVDHQGSAIPINSKFEIWDENNNQIEEEATLISNITGNIVITTNTAIDPEISYRIMYPIPYYYSTNGINSLAAIPYAPISQIGQYKAKVYGIDKVLNTKEINIDYKIKFDPPYGQFLLYNIGGLTIVTANNLDHTTFETSAITTKTGKTVKEGTIVSLMSDASYVKFKNYYEPIADQDELLAGIQIKTDANGKVKFSVAASNTGTANIWVKVESGDAQSTTQSIKFKPDFINKVLIQLPGQYCNTPNSEILGTAITQNAGTSFNIKIIPFDNLNNIVTEINDRMLLSSNDSSAKIDNSGTYSYSKSENINGIYSFTVKEKYTGNKTYTVTDTTRPNISKTSSLTINPATPNKLIVLQESQSFSSKYGKSAVNHTYETGVTFSMSVIIVDEFNNKCNLSTANISIINFNASANVTPSSKVISTIDNTIYIQEYKPGELRQITVTDNNNLLLSNTSSYYKINAGPAKKIIMTFPGEQFNSGEEKHGNPITTFNAGQEIIVTISYVDEYNNIDGNAYQNILLEPIYDDGEISYSPTEPTPPKNGILTFNIKEFIATSSRKFLIKSQLPYFSTIYSPTYNISSSSPDKMIAFLPGENYQSGQGDGKDNHFPEPQYKLNPFELKIIATDAYNNICTSNAKVGIANINPLFTTVVPLEKTFTNGIATFSITEQQTNSGKQINITSNILADINSATYIVQTNAAANKFDILFPGETFSAGNKSGSIIPQKAGDSFIVTINSLNIFKNIVTANEIISLKGPAETFPTTRSVKEEGTVTFSIKYFTSGQQTQIKAEGQYLQGYSEIEIKAGTANKMIIALPGETYSKEEGLTGNISTIKAGEPFFSKIYITDKYDNLISNTKNVTINYTSDYALFQPTINVVNGFQETIITENEASQEKVIIFECEELENITKSFTITHNTYEKLQILLPGQKSLPGSSIGVTGSIEENKAGDVFIVTINAVDIYNNIITETHSILNIEINNYAAIEPTSSFIFTNGSSTVSITEKVAQEQAFITVSSLEKLITKSYTILTGTANSILLIAEGESSLAGDEYSTGKTANKLSQIVGNIFPLNIAIVDKYHNIIKNSLAHQLSITSSVQYGDIDSKIKYLSGGEATYYIKEKIATTINYTVTSSIGFSSTITINVTPGNATNILTLFPGEKFEPGYEDLDKQFKKGTPNIQQAGIPFAITVNMIDQYGNHVNGNDTIRVFSSDGLAPVVSNKVMKNGLVTFNVTEYSMTSETERRIITSLDINKLPNFIDDGSPGFKVTHGLAKTIEAEMSTDVTANGTSSNNIKFFIKDNWSNPVDLQYINITTNRITETIVPITPTTNVSGNSFFEMTSIKAGLIPIFVTVSDSENQNTINGTVYASFKGDASNPSPTLSYLQKTSLYTIAKSGQSNLLSIFCKDINNNPIAGARLSINTNRPTQDTITTINEYTNIEGKALFKISSNALGISLLKGINLDKSENFSSTESIDFVADKDNPNTINSTIVISPSNAKVGKSFEVYITLVDNYNNLITGNEVTIFSSRPSKDEVITINATTGGITDKNYAKFLLKSYKSGAGLVYAKDIKSNNIIKTKTTHQYLFETEKLDYNISYIEASPNNLAADFVSTSSIKVHLTDKFLNPKKEIEVSLISSRTTKDIITTINSITNNDGEASFIINTSYLGNAFLTAKTNDNKFLTQTATMNYIPGSTSLLKSILLISTKNIKINNKDTVTINLWLKDKMDNLLEGVTINVTSSRNQEIITNPITLSDISGFVSLNIRSTKIGTTSITIKDTLNNIVITENLILTFSQDNSMSSSINTTISASSNVIVANNINSSNVTIKLKDIFNNNICGNKIKLIAEGVTISITPTEQLTDINGIASFNIKGCISGLVTISAIDTFSEITINNIQKIKMIADKNRISPTLSMVDILSPIPGAPYIESYANGVDLTKIKITLKDYYGNLVNGKIISANSQRSQDKIVAFNASNYSGYDNENEGVAMFYVSSTIVGLSTINCFDIETNTTLNALANLYFIGDRYNPSQSQSSISMSPTNVIANDINSSNIVIILKDPLGNVISGNELFIESDRTYDNFQAVTLNTNQSGQVTFNIKSCKYGKSLLKVKDNTSRKKIFSNQAINFIAENIPSTINSEVRSDYNEIYVSENIINSLPHSKNESTIYVTVRDNYYNPIINEELYATSDRSEDILTPTSSITDSFGRAQFKLKSQDSGESNISIIHNSSSKIVGKETISFFNHPQTSNMLLSGGTNFIIGTDLIKISVSDDDENINSFSIDTVNVTIENLTDSFYDKEEITLYESGINTGIFDNYTNGVSTSYTDSIPIVSNNIIEGTYYNKIKITYIDKDDINDTQIINAILSIDSIKKHKHVAYLSENKKHVVFRYNLEKNQDINIRVYNLNGHLIWRKKINEGEEGSYNTRENNVIWNLTNSFDTKIKNGLYIYRITNNKEIIYTGKVLVIK